MSGRWRVPMLASSCMWSRKLSEAYDFGGMLIVPGLVHPALANRQFLRLQLAMSISEGVPYHLQLRKQHTADKWTSFNQARV